MLSREIRRLAKKVDDGPFRVPLRDILEDESASKKFPDMMTILNTAKEKGMVFFLGQGGV